MPNSPLISVILQVYNGKETIDRAINSVLGQTFRDWELLVVDDCSTDGTYEFLKAFAEKDSRIRVYQTQVHSGPPACRNLGLQHTVGEYVCYLECEDEYYPDYLETVANIGLNCSVLVFCNDMKEEGWNEGDPIATWHPQKISSLLYLRKIVGPLNIAHHRDLMLNVGRFNELCWCNDFIDLIRRFNRTETAFIFIQNKSGCHWRRKYRHKRVEPLTLCQQSTIEANWHMGRPLYGKSLSGRKSKPAKTIVFASRFSAVDFTNGASIATMQHLQLLQELGFVCRVFCATHLDASDEKSVEATLEEQKTPYEVRKVKVGDYTAQFIFTEQGGVPVTLFKTKSTLKNWDSKVEIETFLSSFRSFLDENRPDALLTYGGDPISQTMIQMAKTYDIPVVFGLHNFSYTNLEAFKSVDYVLVPSEYSRQYHWDRFGLACHCFPNVIDEKRILVDHRRPQYLTFVNPELDKGVFVFFRIALELAKRRPDIPVLIVEGRAQAGRLGQWGLNTSGLHNVHIMPNTPDPRKFYGMTKILLLPSLCRENAPLVIAEGMLNGIPILASNRGGLPEMICDAGFVFDIPERLTPQSKQAPTGAEIAPWIETIISLWDNADLYNRYSEISRHHAERWRPHNLAPLYRHFFSSLCPQPCPPFVPRTIMCKTSNPS
jgi:glycosyltransferase involved in cell wall biosynthesis